MFDEFKAKQSRKKEEEEKKQKEVEEMKELEKQMANIKLNDYKPKYGQDPQLFNAMYIDYINQLT